VPVADFGNNVRYFHAVDFNIRGQLKGLTVRGSTSTGRQVTDTCDLIVDNPSRRNCHTALPFQTTLSAMAAYTVPKVRVQASGVLHSNAGTLVSANLVVPSATIQQTLGRPLAGGTANVTINLLDPGQMYRDRVTLLDLRFAKLIDIGRKRINVGLDIFNALNADVVLNSNNTYGTAWLTPTAVQSARQLQASMRFDF
jgi:hypothetical protein